MKAIETVAVIDDDAVYQYVATRTIKSTKLVKTIQVFSDGREAIDFFSANISDSEKLPDVIFLDLNMPIMDGWQFLKHFTLLKLNIGKKIIIYIVTSSMNNEDVNRAQNLSEVTGYIIKPITVKKFKDIVEVLQ